MKKEEFNIFGLLARYILLILLGLPLYGLFYIIFGPLTLYPVYFLLSLFYETTLFGYIIYTNNIPIEIISACIAGAAYYLFTILNFSTPKMKACTRIKVLLLSFLIFLIVNILRIVFLVALYLSGSVWFDFTHELFWYALSTIFVVIIWFFLVKKYKITEIPFYSDIKELYTLSILGKRKKRKRKE